VATVPPAADLFSTTTGCRSILEPLADRRAPAQSIELPAGAATTDV
jgi:hypothetical protein